MSKINEVIKLNTGYASAVDLQEEFTTPEKNRARMERYQPIDSHRAVFEKLADILKPKDKRSYLLTGHYGTGKSHLLLMMANFFSNKSDTPELKTFFDNYAEVDDAKAKYLRALRSQGRYLVAICDYRTKEDFEEVILRAISSACRREGFSGDMDTHYNEALRRLEEWEEARDSGKARLDFLTAFSEELEERYPDYTVDSLRKGLKSFEGDSLEIFKEIHRNIANFDFSYNKNNLNAILKDLLTSEKFKEKYDGLIVLYDEFGYTLQNARMSVDIIQGFGELCTQGISDGGLLAFIGTAHKTFSSYSGAYAKEDFNKVSDRIDEIELKPEGLEDVIAAIVVPQKESEIWQNEIQKREGVFGTFLTKCTQLKLFNWLSAPQIREKIIENVYPMHPMATYCLLQLSTNVGSANRTVFTFFGSEAGHEKDEGSYSWFIERNEILSPSGLLNLYTVDLLVTYFKSELRSENPEIRETLRKILLNYENCLREYKKLAEIESLVGEDELALRILHTMLVYEISGIANSETNIEFGLNLQTQEMRTALKNRLDSLVDNGILYLNPTAQTYEFRQSQSRDFDVTIEDYKSDDSNIPSDLAKTFTELVKLEREFEYLEARQYNSAYNEDKRMKREMVMAADFGRPVQTKEGEQDFFEYYESLCNNEAKWKDRFEGIALYVICESQEEINKAKQKVRGNSKELVIVAIPNQPIPILDTIMNLKAAEDIRKSPEFDNFSTQDRARLLEDYIGNESKGFTKEFLDKRRRYFEGKNSTWYGKNGEVFTSKPKTEHDAVDKLFERIYEKHNKIKHNELNLSHKLRKYEPSKNVQLRDAINLMLQSESDIIVDTDYGEDKGQIRYIHKMAQHGVFRQIGKANGTKIQYQVNPNSQEYSKTFPALADMISEVRNLDEGEKLNVTEFMLKYTQPPYGLGPISLCLFFACVVKNFGDSLRLKKDEAAIGDLPIQDFEIINELLEGKYQNAFLLHKELSQPEHDFLDKVYELFSPSEEGFGTHRSVVEAHTAIKDWWNNLPSISKSTELYDNESTVNLINEFTAIQDFDAHTFMFSELQTAYGYAIDDLMTEALASDMFDKLKADKTAIEESFNRVKEEIIAEVKELFGAEGNTYDDIKDAMMDWYNGLDDYQRDQFGDWHSNESKPIIQSVKKISDISKTLFEDIPASQGFGLGKVSDWNRNRTNEYIQKLREGKKHIEANKIVVNKPLWEIVSPGGSYKTSKKGGKEKYINYLGELKIEIKVPQTGTRVFVTNNDEDPSQSDAQRREVTSSYLLSVNGRNMTVKMVAVDDEGHKSPTVVLHLTNEYHKHEFQLAEDTLPNMDIPVKLVFPKDAQSLSVTAHSLFDRALERDIIDKDEAVDIIRKLLNQFE